MFYGLALTGVKVTEKVSGCGHCKMAIRLCERFTHSISCSYISSGLTPNS